MKTKEELIAGIKTAIDGTPAMYDPSQISTLDHLESVFGSAIRNRIGSMKNRLEKDGIAELIAYCRSKATEYDRLQEKHAADIRNFRNELSNNRILKMMGGYPGDLHVVSENPLMYGMTLVLGDGPVALANFTEDTLNMMLEDIAETCDLPGESGNEIPCPVCGSRWQLFDTVPVVHCARCNAHWVLFSRRLLKTERFLDPVRSEMSIGRKMRDEYLADTGYTVSNPDALKKVKRAVAAVPGDKVVTIRGITGKYDGWVMSFRVRDGVIENEPHFDECIDSALVACRYSGDMYRGDRMTEAMMVLIRAPKSPEADLDELCRVCGSMMQAPCNTYGIVFSGGELIAMDREQMAKAYDDDDPSLDDFGDLDTLCPWFNGSRKSPLFHDAPDGAPKGKRREIVN